MDKSITLLYRFCLIKIQIHHASKLGLLRSEVIFPKLTCPEMHLLELCGILRLHHLEKTNAIGTCLNESPGYDNFKILSASGECALYILTSLESFEKKSKSTGKLLYRNKDLFRTAKCQPIL